MKPQVLTHLFKALEEAERENERERGRFHPGEGIIDTRPIRLAIESVIAVRHGSAFVGEILRRLGDPTNATDYEIRDLAKRVIAGK